MVGQLVWQRSSERGSPIVRPARDLESETDAATTLSKLRYLITATAPGSFERLQMLRSRFWSFVEVNRAGSRPPEAERAEREPE